MKPMSPYDYFVTVLLLIALIVFVVHQIEIWSASPGERIVLHARRQLGLPYCAGGGQLDGPTYGADNKNEVGFNCSGLTRYAVYQATGKIIGRTPAQQYYDPQARRIPFEQAQPGDIAFYSYDAPLVHVVIISEGNYRMIHAGKWVKEKTIYKTGREPYVARFW